MNTRAKEMERLHLEEGLTMRSIANMYGVSRQRVHQIIGTVGNAAYLIRRQQLDNTVAMLPAWMSASEISGELDCRTQSVLDSFVRIGRSKFDIFVARFWNKVELPESADDCFLWIGHCHPITGYGRCNQSYLETPGDLSHRIAWVLAHWEIENGFHVLHTCDTPNCVNVRHLFLGTHADNMADRNRKGRQARGERSGTAKLTDEIVIYLRSILDPDDFDWAECAMQAEKFEVNVNTIHKAVRGITWAHLQ